MTFFRPNILSMHGYVPGEQPRPGQEYVKLNTNENPYPCSPAVKAAVGRAIQGGLNRYPDPLATQFREAAAARFAADVPGITPDWILCGNGSDELLTMLFRAFLDTGDVVRFCQPSYVLYKVLADIQGATSEVVDYAADWKVGPKFTAPRERLKLAMLVNPNSPSGTLTPPSDVARMAAALPCPLVVDEAYADFADANCLPLVAANERVIVTRSFSKSYALAGLRFGYAVAQPQVITELRKLKDSYNCDALSIAGATAAFEDRDWFTRNRTTILATRERMTAALRGLGFACVDSQANFVWCNHPRHKPKSLYRQLKDAGILVRYMNYGAAGEGLRISVGTDEQIDVLLAKLAELLSTS